MGGYKKDFKLFYLFVITNENDLEVAIRKWEFSRQKLDHSSPFIKERKTLLKKQKAAKSTLKLSIFSGKMARKIKKRGPRCLGVVVGCLKFFMDLPNLGFWPQHFRLLGRKSLRPAWNSSRLLYRLKSKFKIDNFPQDIECCAIFFPFRPKVKASVIKWGLLSLVTVLEIKIYGIIFFRSKSGSFMDVYFKALSPLIRLVHFLFACVVVEKTKSKVCDCALFHH